MQSFEYVKVDEYLFHGLDKSNFSLESSLIVYNQIDVPVIVDNLSQLYRFN